MAAAKVEIIYEAEATSLKASINEINKSNDQVVDSAKKTASKIVEEFKGAAVGAGKAFANQQFVGALKNLNNGVAGLTNTLKLNTEAFKKFDTEAQKTNKILVQSAQDVAKYEDRLRELSVAGQRNTDEFKDIAKAVGEYKSAIIAADRAVDLYAKSTDAATGRIGELEDKLYDLALAGQSNTQEFRDLVKEVATVRRAVIETDAQVDALAQRGAKLKGFVQSVELVGVAFQAVEGAAALVGEENEELQKTLVRLQAIIAITSALEQGRVIIMEQLAAKTGIAGLAQKAYTLAVAASTGAISAFRVALAATGIGLFITGIALLVTKLQDAAANQASLNRSLELSKQAAENSKKAIEELRNAQLDSATRTLIATGQLDQAEADRLETIKGIRKQVDENINVELAAQTKLIVEKQKLEQRLAVFKDAVDGDVIRKQRKNIQDQIDNQEAEIKKSQENVRQIRQAGLLSEAQFNQALRTEESAKDRDEAQKLADDRKKAAEDAAKAEIEARNAAREKLRQLELEALASQLDEREKILNDSNTKIAELEATFAEAKFAKGSEQEQQLQTSINLIKEQAAKDIAAIDQKALEDKAAKEKEAAEKLAKETSDIRIAGLDAQINAIKTLEITEGTSLDRRIQLIELDSKKRIELAKDNASEIELINAQTEEAIRAERKKTADESIDLAFKIAEETGSLLNSAIDVLKEQSQQRIELINQDSAAELEAINKSIESEADKQRKREALELRTSRKLAAEKTKQAKLDKALAIFNAIINTAGSILKTGEQLGYPLAIPFQVAAGVIGGIQLAAITSQPIPKFKKGGMVGGRSHEAGGTLIEAERGEYVVNKNSVMRNRRELDAINTSSAAFKRLIDERYVRPAILSYAMNNKRDGITVNASLNSKSMERKLDKLNKTMAGKQMIVNINGGDSRYTWQ